MNLREKPPDLWGIAAWRGGFTRRRGTSPLDTFAVLSNDADLNSEKLAREIAKLVLKWPDEPKEGGSPQVTSANRVEPEKPEKNLLPYAGDYWSEELQTVYRVALRDEKLMMRSGFHPWTLLFPESGDTFKSSRIPELDIEARIEFTRNQRDEVIGMKMSARRVKNIQFSRVSLPQR